MKKLYLLLITLILVSSIMLSSCTTIPEDKKCVVDDDCTAATCCHASEAVNLLNAPGCGGVLCTANCEPGTLDCGQAKAMCVEGACKVVPVEE